MHASILAADGVGSDLADRAIAGLGWWLGATFDR